MDRNLHNLLLWDIPDCFSFLTIADKVVMSIPVHLSFYSDVIIFSERTPLPVPHTHLPFGAGVLVSGTSFLLSGSCWSQLRQLVKFRILSEEWLGGSHLHICSVTSMLQVTYYHQGKNSSLPPTPALCPVCHKKKYCS